MTFTDTLPTPAQAGPGPLAIDLRGLHKSFGSVRAVDGIDLAITPGEVVAFLGPNGAGKTTTIDMLLGLARPDAGSVSVLGLDPNRAIAEGRVSAVMQSGGLLKDLTVGETVELTASFFRASRSAGEVLARAGIADIADRKVGTCSGGQQQRLRFALALLPDPDVIVLDEPTTGMDVEGRRDFWTALRADASRGRTILFATHYLEEADAYADRIVLVSHGRIVADGSAAQVKNLASGRLVTATLPDVTAAQTTDLEAIPGVQSVELRRDRLLVRTSDSDGVARHLLTATAASDIEITARGLEDAFLALTGDHDTTGSPA
ncbi:ABC transporter ATP-binding protein [Cellulomonas humilata]|uniref:ABC-2 type transport system ATP-binding protein n=1 Tax=Cellulomonas humilata TaxID=144055 RepID=A0ABU0EDZ4_9CELL|nr:ABC transporter ATP-binding protein [Cellulomonas humilata]MDQ0373483.1 ABC-2 type transport system ATP-binding protein [Cellulomonas humilata]